MKKILFSLFISTILAFSLMYLQSCDIKNPTENVKLLINTDAPGTSISINIIDGRTNLPVPGERTIAIDIEGPDKGKITDMGKSLRTSFLSADGLVSFGVADGASYPLNITVVVKTDGYITTSVPLKINANGGAFDIYVVNKSAPPTGVVVNSGIITTALNGVAQSAGTISTTISNGAAGISKIRLPAGTIITDNLGSPLNGNLTCEIAYYDPTVESARRCFPGGYTVSSGGTSYTMYTAGFSSIVISESSGKIAKNFSGTLPEITIEIPTGTNNFNFSRPIQTGDLIPILSYDPSNGIWADENASGGTVINGSNSNFAITFNTNHLTYYNLDFKDPSCTNDIRIHFPSQCDSSIGQPLHVEVYSVTKNGIENRILSVNQPSNDPVMILNSAPQRFRLKVSNLSGTVLYNQVISGCPGDVFVTFSGGTVSYPIGGTLTCVCSDQELQFNPTIPIYFRKSNTERFYYFGYMVNGYINTTCIPYGNYDFMSYYDGHSLYNMNVPIFSNNVNVTYIIPDCTP